MKHRAFLPILLFVFVMGQMAFAAAQPDPNPPAQPTLQSELEDFSLPGWDRQPASLPEALPGSPFVPEAGPQVSQYRRHLAEGGSWGGPIWHQMGTLPLVLPDGKTERLGINVFEPGGSKGTLMLLHGYRAHAGDLAFTQAWFASRGWRVVTLDLPGHGISEGPHGDIDDFSEYGDAVALWMNWVFQQGWPGPRILLAHSLGAAAALEALRRPGALRPDRIIFCSPLLRTSWYPALWLTDQMMGWLLVPVSETFGWNDNAATIHWFHVLGTWLAKLDLQKPLDLPLVVYSGDRDSVVDKSWDQSKYEELIPGVQWVTLPGKGHWFISDSLERQAFHERLWADLEREAPIPPLAQE